MRLRLLLAAGTLAVVACGNDVTTNDGLSILTHDNDTVMDALGSFTLELDEERGCLYHDEPDNNGEPGTGGRVVVVWPAGFSIERTDDGAQILDADRRVVAASGETFQIGGGSGGTDPGHCDAIGSWIAAGPPLGPAD